MSSKTQILNETISLMALGNGKWEYFNITCMEDLKKAYKDFDERIAHDTDIEYLRDENKDKAIEVIKDILNATHNIEETKRIIENEKYGYYYGRNELDAFQNYLYETDFYYNIPEHIHCYIDVEKVKRDYYFIDIDSTDKFEEYLFIFD